MNNDDVCKSFDLPTCDRYGSDKAHPRSRLAKIIIQTIYVRVKTTNSYNDRKYKQYDLNAAYKYHFQTNSKKCK